ncbi:MAG: hypothetical protein ACLUZ6_04800 [Lachnospira eligens]
MEQYIWLANNGVHKALGIILIVQIVIALLMLVFEGKIWKWILAIIDFILMGVSVNMAACQI